MKRTIVALLIVTMAAVVIASAASAFTMSEKVVVANSLVAIARAPAGGMTADERIDRENERLAYILGYERLDPASIRLGTCNGERVISVGNTTLITVTAADARANGTTVEGLAQRWLARARAAIPQARPTPAIPG